MGSAKLDLKSCSFALACSSIEDVDVCLAVDEEEAVLCGADGCGLGRVHDLHFTRLPPLPSTCVRSIYCPSVTFLNFFVWVYFCLRGRFPSLPRDFLHGCTIILQRFRIIVGDEDEQILIRDLSLRSLVPYQRATTSPQ